MTESLPPRLPPIIVDPRCEPPERDEVPSWARSVVAACLLIPAGLFAFAMAGGLLIAEGPQSGGSIGQEPARPLKILVALVVAAALIRLTVRWMGGHPHTARGAWALMIGLILLVVATQRGFIGNDNFVAAPLGAIGLGLTLWGYFGDR